jgi:DNA-binding beta-propeller fold protein YncE
MTMVSRPLPRDKITAVVRNLAWLVPSLMISAIWAQAPKRSPTGPVGDGRLVIKASINGPRGIAIDHAKTAYVIECFRDWIRCIDLNTGLVSTIKPQVKLEAMDSILVDAAGDLIVTEFTVDRVRKVHPQDGSVSLIAGALRMKFTGDGGPAQAAGLSSPRGTALDADGNLYIVDMGNNRIRRVDAKTGIISTVAGSGKRDSSGDGGPALLAGLEYPSSIAIDRSGKSTYRSMAMGLIVIE